MNYRNTLRKIHTSLAGRRRLKTVIFFVTSLCNAKCRTCFYWEELNQRGDLTLDEIRKLSRTMPQFTDLWLSGGEPMLRKELVEIVHLFCAANGVRWVNLPTNGLLPERTVEWVERILAENPELDLDLNVAMDGLYEMQDSIRAVPGNFAKTLETLEAIQPCRERHCRLRVNVNTVICAENFDHVLEIAEFVKRECAVDGHYFNIIRGNAPDPNLQQISAERLERLPALYREIQKLYHHYAPTIRRRLEGIERILGEAYYEGTMAFHNKVQLANLRDFDCDFGKFWETPTRQEELQSIARDQCWCTHICFIHDSLRQSPKVMLYDIPVTYLESQFSNRT